MLMTTEKIWEEFGAKLKRFILKRVPEEQNAEDILQDVFLKIHTHIHTLRDEDKLQSWIYQITRNAIHDYYRSHQVMLVVTDFPELLVIQEDLPGENVMRDLSPSVRNMIDCLPGNYREALILTEYEGLTQKELSEKLGISLPGAKSRVQRAREKLKAMLLDCCHFQFDRWGSIIDYQPRCACCVNGCSASVCRTSQG